MSNEQKIREAFEKGFINTLSLDQGKDAWGRDQYVHPYVQCLFDGFRTGYMALLNELELVGENKVEKLYRLPKGVNHDTTGT